MEPWSRDLSGRIEEIEIESALLRDNPLGDPHRRPLWVYLPPAYDREPARRFPVIYRLQGLTGQLDMWRNRSPFRPNDFELTDALFSDGETPPCIVVYFDAWTSYGGSQFVDSPAIGKYHSYFCEEVVPFVDTRYRTLASREHRGLSGKSSGGYGAMITPMLRPDLFAGLATHAGDALFEHCYQPGFPESVRALRDHYDGSFDAFWEDFRSRPALSKGSDMSLLNTWCMAACYSADSDGTVRLPFDTRTAAMLPDVWERWLAWDPVRMVPKHREAVRSMRAIWIDSGNRDEFYLDLGAEAFRRALAKEGVEDVHFELFDGTHRAVEYRYPLALGYLARRLSA